MSRVLELWRNLSLIYKIAITAVLLGIIIFATVMSAKPSTYQVLYSNLDQNDSRDIVKELVKMGIDYQQPDTATISIDGAKTASVRIQLANLGLPRSGNPGLESLSQTSIGDTRYDKEKKYAAALKGQLERDLVDGIDVVDRANVQLSIAEDTSIFKDNSSKSKATVSVGIKDGEELDDSQIKGIQNFVAAAITNMKAKDVVVLDENGTLLSDNNGDSTSQYKSFSKQDQIVQQTEERVKTDIMNSLSKIFGYDHVTVNVRANINFDEIVRNIEKYDPKGTLVSKQTNKEEASKNNGTTTTEPGVEGNGDVPDYKSADSSSDTGVSQTKEEVIENYDVGKTVETIKKNPELTDMNVVVWVDRDMKKDELDTLKRAIATAAGIKDSNKDGKFENGDVEVIPVVFKQNEKKLTDVNATEQKSFFDKLLENPKMLATYIGLLVGIIAIIILLSILGKKRKENVVYKETAVYETLDSQNADGINSDERIMSEIDNQKAKYSANGGDNEKHKELIDQVRKASEDIDRTKDYIKQNLHEE